MNLSKLFELQKELDQHIIQEKRLQGEDLLDKKILALQVELGELANEWRGFKFWSEDQEPRTEVYYGPLEIPDVGTYANPLLEEYVDCLHFILSIGLELNIPTHYSFTPTPNIFGNDIIRMFRWLITDAVMVNFLLYVNHFMYLGELLGFTWEQIEKAYLEKNKINHQRQENGY